MEAPPLTEEELNEIYNWVDEIPLSRPKKNIARDFADGVLMAEILGHFVPKLVEIHNYTAAHSVHQKQYNWNTLNQKVLKKMGFQLAKVDIESVIAGVPEAIERVLRVVRLKIDKHLKEGREKPAYIMGPPPVQATLPPQVMMIPGGPRMGGAQGGIEKRIMEPSAIANSVPQKSGASVRDLLAEKDQTIQELRETIEILETKTKKLEQLVKLKDSKINTLTNKLAQYEGN